MVYKVTRREVTVTRFSVVPRVLEDIFTVLPFFISSSTFPSHPLSFTQSSPTSPFHCPRAWRSAVHCKFPLQQVREQPGFKWFQPFNGHIKTATDHYTAIRWLVHWPLMGGLLHLVQRGGATPLLAIPNVTAHPSTASVPTSYYSMWHYNYLCQLKG